MNAQLPTNVDIAHARLPATYEQAKVALASCERLDECQEWANKAEALASYAKMADDDSLRMLADRIQSRAVNRMGVLLKTFNAQGQRADILPDGAVRKLTQTEAARAAGISERQQVTAVRVSNIPTEQFEALVESDKPPTVTALAEMGKQTRSVPEGFKQATHLIGSVRRFAEFCEENAPHVVANGVMTKEVVELRALTAVIDVWLRIFRSNLKG